MVDEMGRHVMMGGKEMGLGLRCLDLDLDVGRMLALGLALYGMMRDDEMGTVGCCTRESGGC